MNNSVKCGIISFALLLAANAQAGEKAGHFLVTVTNMTAGQKFSKPVVVAHKKNFALFEAGQPASTALAGLAQDGDADGLAASLEKNGKVYQTMVGADLILPGESESVEIMANKGGADYISVAAMLADTNDAFLVLDGAMVPMSPQDNMVDYAVAYDAGAEDNDESCLYIPAPPCGHAHAASDVPGEGYVYVHPGIRGDGDLPQKTYNWQNPVAKIVIQRMP